MEMEKAKLLESDADLHIDKKQKTEHPQVEALVAPPPLSLKKYRKKRNLKAAVDEVNSWFNTGDMVLCPPTICFPPILGPTDRELAKIFPNYLRLKRVQQIIDATPSVRF